MKRKNDIWPGMMAAFGMALMIMDGKTALTGAREGVTLCLNTLIPTLLPFFFLSNILTGALMGKKIRILRPVGRLCRIPEGAEYILLTGFLGGYPLGAHEISLACESGSLSPEDGRRMLAFCNNCGPAFLFGVTGVLFQDPTIPWVLFGIHLASALLVGIILPGRPEPCTAQKRKNTTAVQALWRALRAISGVCGWVILFRSALAVMERWLLWYFPVEVRIALSGILELSNGCIGLAGIENTAIRFILCSVFLSFGGLCVTMQTYSAAQGIDRSLYFPGKALQTTISITLACLLCAPVRAIIPGIVAVMAGIFLGKWENRCRNPEKLVV